MPRSEHSVIRRYFSRLEKRWDEDFELAGVGHDSGDKGGNVEEIIRADLERMLPERARVFRGGKIVGFTDLPGKPPATTSRQVDLVIYSNFAPSLGLHEKGLFLAEGVICVAEIKYRGVLQKTGKHKCRFCGQEVAREDTPGYLCCTKNAIDRLMGTERRSAGPCAFRKQILPTEVYHLEKRSGESRTYHLNVGLILVGEGFRNLSVDAVIEALKKDPPRGSVRPTFVYVHGHFLIVKIATPKSGDPEGDLSCRITFPVSDPGVRPVLFPVSEVIGFGDDQETRECYYTYYKATRKADPSVLQVFVSWLSEEVNRYIQEPPNCFAYLSADSRSLRDRAVAFCLRSDREKFKRKTWRFVCSDWNEVDSTLSQIEPTLRQMEEVGIIDRWYATNRPKDPENKASFRICLRFKADNEKKVVEKIQEMQAEFGLESYPGESASFWSPAGGWI